MKFKVPRDKAAASELEVEYEVEGRSDMEEDCGRMAEPVL